MSEQSISDSCFCLDLNAIKGVIIFPSLGTPAIVEANGQLTVYLALEKQAFEKHILYGGAQMPGSPVPEWLARQFYFQTIITPWTDRGRDYVSYKKYAGELASAAAPFNRFYSNHQVVSEKYAQKKFGGFYIGKFEAGQEFLVNYYPLGQGVQPPQGPFGVIHRAAVNMYLSGDLTDTVPQNAEGDPYPKGANAKGKSSSETNQATKAPSNAQPNQGDLDDAGYPYVFQFTVSQANNLDFPGLFELMFLYINFKDYSDALRDGEDQDQFIFNKENDLHVQYLTNPGDELISKALISELNSKSNELKSNTSIINIVEFERFRSMKPKKIQLAKLCDTTPTAVLTQGQKDASGVANAAKGGGEQYLHYLSDKNGWFVLSRHPVYITDKNYLDIGVVNDLHLSSRQVSYKLVAPQVIHGAAEEESPYIGRLCHQTLETSQRLIKAIGAESDALIVAGDAFDVLRNFDLKIVEAKNHSPLRPSDLEETFGPEHGP
ncbi:MAG: hypothetical protein LBE31_10845 [Deltaproteobacteria bacterium]|jgi:hypothetical protein|nr:hypothetical protein [Deltaproteobacteria bacterium]